MEHCQWSSIKQKLWCKKWNFYSTEVLKSDLCDYNDAYVLVRGDITIVACNAATLVAFKNCAPFIKKVDGTKTDDAEGLVVAILMYNC